MTMLAKQETYSKGMAEFGEEEQLELTPELGGRVCRAVRVMDETERRAFTSTIYIT